MVNDIDLIPMRDPNEVRHYNAYAIELVLALHSTDEKKQELDIIAPTLRISFTQYAFNRNLLGQSFKKWKYFHSYLIAVHWVRPGQVDFVCN